MTTVTEGEEITEGTVGIMKQNALQVYINSMKKLYSCQQGVNSLSMHHRQGCQ